MVGGVADVEKVELKLKEINRNYLEKSKRYDEYYEQYQNAAQDILTKRQVHARSRQQSRMGEYRLFAVWRRRGATNHMLHSPECVSEQVCTWRPPA